MISDAEKIKNAIRIIDGRLDSLTGMKREMEKRTFPFEKISPTILLTALDLVNLNLRNLQEIRDELRPKKKST